MPSLDAILLGHTRTLRHVPAAARSLWGKVLTRALAAAVHHNDTRAWQELLMLPQAVLDVPQRGGRKHAKAVAANTVDGERAGLWESRWPPLPPSGRERTANQRKELATGLAREGFDSKARAALLADGLCAETPATIAALQQLHPTQPNPAVPPFHELCPGPLVEPDMVSTQLSRCIRSWPLRPPSAAPSGCMLPWNYRHPSPALGRRGCASGQWSGMRSGGACALRCTPGCCPEAKRRRAPHRHRGALAAPDRKVPHEPTPHFGPTTFLPRPGRGSCFRWCGSGCAHSTGLA